METQGKQGQVVITIDVKTGKLVNVTDGEGRGFEQFKPTQEDPLVFTEVYNSLNVGTIFYVRTNPCYVYYWRDGSLQRQQVPCP